MYMLACSHRYYLKKVDKEYGSSLYDFRGFVHSLCMLRETRFSLFNFLVSMVETGVLLVLVSGRPSPSNAEKRPS